VYQYKEGDYFGELALLHDIPRQASVKAVSRVIVAKIEREAFMRLLGSLEDILKRNEDRYRNYQEKLNQ
jgi:cAMP-dependent protein kinase regulator